MVLSQLLPNDPKMVQVLFLIVVFQSLHMVLSQLLPNDPKMVQVLFLIVVCCCFPVSAHGAVPAAAQ